MRLFTVIILFILSLPIYAEIFFTGGKLLEHCDSCVHSVNVSNISACAYCISDTSLIHDAFVERGLIEPKWCINSGITLKELTKTTIMFIRENPIAYRQFSTTSVANSFEKNYPCDR